MGYVVGAGVAPNQTLHIIKIVAIVCAVITVLFILLWIIGQVYIKQASDKNANKFLKNIIFWFGNAGVFFAWLRVILFVIFIGAIVVVAVNAPTWIQQAKLAQVNVANNLEELTMNVNKVALTTDTFLQKLPETINTVALNLVSNRVNNASSASGSSE